MQGLFLCLTIHTAILFFTKEIYKFANLQVCIFHPNLTEVIFKEPATNLSLKKTGDSFFDCKPNV